MFLFLLNILYKYNFFFFLYISEISITCSSSLLLLFGSLIKVLNRSSNICKVKAVIQRLFLFVIPSTLYQLSLLLNIILHIPLPWVSVIPRSIVHHPSFIRHNSTLLSHLLHSTTHHHHSPRSSRGASHISSCSIHWRGSFKTLALHMSSPEMVWRGSLLTAFQI